MAARSRSGARGSAVLAHLLAAANRVVTMGELIERVWDEEPPRAARNTIRATSRTSAPRSVPMGSRAGAPAT